MTSLRDSVPSGVRWLGYLDECLESWPTSELHPCAPWNPTSQHMCIDGDDSIHFGHESHDPDYHTCRCGIRRWRDLYPLTRAQRRLLRDARVDFENSERGRTEDGDGEGEVDAGVRGAPGERPV